MAAELEPSLSDAEVAANSVIDRLIERLGSGDYMDRGRAERDLTSRGYIALSACLKAVTAEQRKRRRRRMYCRVVGLPVLATTVIATVLASGGHVGTMLPFFFVLLAISMVIVEACTRTSLRHKALLRVIASSDDVRAVGKFAEALDMGSADDYATSRLARNVLVRLLPRVMESDSEHITVEQQLHLCHALKSGDHELVVAALNAIGQVGGAEAIPYVDTLSARDPAMREQAARCLQLLTARATTDAQRETLLRSSALSDAPNEHLLRASAATHLEKSEELLRGSMRSDNRS